MSLWKDTWPTAMSPVFFHFLSKRKLRGHGSRCANLEIVCWRVYYCHIVLLIPCLHMSEWVRVVFRMSARTLNRVGLNQLCTVCEKCLRYIIPIHGFGHAQVNMGRRQFINMKPDILRPCVFDQVLIYDKTGQVRTSRENRIRTLHLVFAHVYNRRGVDS